MNDIFECFFQTVEEQHCTPHLQPDLFKIVELRYGYFNIHGAVDEYLCKYFHGN